MSPGELPCVPKMEDYENHKNFFFNPKVYFSKKRLCEISSQKTGCIILSV